MKVYEYEYYESWGEGQGIVIAESEEHAIELMIAQYGYNDKSKEELFPNLMFTEIDVTQPQVIDHSWTE